MYPVLWEIGPFRVYSWGFALALATILAWIGISRRFKEQRLNPDYVIEMLVAMVICGVLGGRVMYIILYQWQELMADPATVLDISRGISGLVWYGSFIGGFLAFLICILYRKLPLMLVTDIESPYLALGYAIVRVGCFMNGCCYGKVTDSAWGVIFAHGGLLPRYPTQLFSSALNLIIFAILWRLYRQRRFDGQVFSVYLMLYAVYRFLVEFWRENSIYFGIFSYAQLVACGLFAAGAVLYMYLARRSGGALQEAASDDNLDS